MKVTPLALTCQERGSWGDPACPCCARCSAVWRDSTDQGLMGTGRSQKGLLSGAVPANPRVAVLSVSPQTAGAARNFTATAVNCTRALVAWQIRLYRSYAPGPGRAAADPADLGGWSRRSQLGRNRTAAASGRREVQTAVHS